MLAPRDNLWLSADAIRAHKLRAALTERYTVKDRTEPNHCE
jgi:hypothetical protein